MVLNINDKLLYMSRILLLCAFLAVCVSLSGRTVSVRCFGAKGDGKVCTKSLNDAIKSARDNDTVLIPEGRYVTGTVRLKSHITLLIDKGAELLGVQELDAYDHYRPSKDMTKYDTGNGTKNANLTSDAEWTKALVLCQQAEDVIICGSGIIDGQHVVNPNGEESMRGPHALLLAECRNVRVTGVSISCAGNYAILGYELTDALFSNLSITQGWDGIHIRGGVDIAIRDCEITTGDDAIAGGYWENMRITGCRINSSCNGIRMIEPSRNLFVGSCHIYGPGRYAHRTNDSRSSIYGITLEPGAWGNAPGDTENVRIANVTIDNVLSPLTYSMGENNSCSGLYIENLTATHITYNTLPLNWQGGDKMWNDIVIENYIIRNGY